MELRAEVRDGVGIAEVMIVKVAQHSYFVVIREATFPLTCTLCSSTVMLLCCSSRRWDGGGL